MREFFKSRRFKMLAIVLAVLILLSTVSGVVGKWMEPQSSLLGAVIVPVQKFTTFISDKVTGFVTAYQRAERLTEENDELREQVHSLTDDLIDYEQYKSENEYLKEFLEIKEANDDFTFENANVISDDVSSGYLSFTVDSGSLDGVALYDPVMTDDGLIGYVSEVAPTYCVVMTVLDPSLSVGACCARTGDYGVVSGFAGASDGTARMSFLSSSTTLSQGDYIVTSGLGGVFPAGLVIGTVERVQKDDETISAYAHVKPAADLSSVREVMIITSFSGQNTAK